MDGLPRPSLLSIPQPIRQRIYREAGLAVDWDIDFNWLRNEIRYTGNPLKDSYGNSPIMNRYASTYNILLTCRFIYAEASAIVYSTNRFFIGYKDASNLKALMNLRESSLAYLTHLTIHLNVTSCSRGSWDRCCAAGDRWSSDDTICTNREYRRHVHDKPLGTSSQDNTVLSEWRNAARHIAAHIRPLTLKLFFVSDVENLEVGQLAVRPLRSFPTLADCSIRLNRMHHHLLQVLAMEAATRAKGLPYPPKNEGIPFRFLDLPTEVRLRILEYTDLVTPWREVEWSPKHNFYLTYADRSCIRGQREFGDCPPDEHHVCQFYNCWNSEPTRVGCFCHRYHTAFSTKCNCWIPPKPLFLTCKTLRQDAQFIFFTKNHFVVTPVAGCIHPAERSPDRLEASIFLNEVVPPTALHFLRSLEIVFPPFHDDYLRSYEPAYKQWLQVIDRMCQLNLPMLNLSVVVADPEYARIGEQFRGTMSRKQATTIFKMYSRTLRPLSKLRENGLQAFFTTLASPFAWTDEGVHWLDRDRNNQQKEDRILHYTQLIEQAIMGEDYDSSLIRHKAHGQSQWLKRKLFIDQAC